MTQVPAYIISYFVEGIIGYLFINSVFELKTTQIRTICVTLFFYGIQFAGTFLHSSTFNTIFFFICNAVLIFSVCKTSVLLSIFNSGILTALMILTELIASNFTQNALFIHSTANLIDPQLILFFIMSKTLYLFSVLILVKIMQIYKLDGYSYTPESITITIITVMSFAICVLLFYICTQNILNTFSEYLLIACSLCLIIINILVFWLQNYTNRNHLRMMQLQSQLQRETDEAHYYKMLQNHDNEQRILIHDIKNHLAAISALARHNDNSGIQKYVDSLVSTPALNTIIDKTPNPHLNMLLSRYSAICLSKDIVFHIDVQGDGLSCVKPEELVALLSNLLDNAITAAERTDSAYINLKISETGHKNSIISAANSCRQNPEFGADNIPHTTKQDLAHHGFGLKSVRKILEQYNGHMTSSYDDKSRQYLVIIGISGDAV